MDLRSCADYVSNCSVQCNFIFRAQELDLGRLATAFGLLRLPGMPELAHHRGNLPNFTPSSVDPNTIKVTDTREIQHQMQEFALNVMSLAEIPCANDQMVRCHKLSSADN